jgi:hypothetical protein
VGNSAETTVNVEAPKRGRGRPKGSKNKNSQGGTIDKTMAKVFAKFMATLEQGSDAELACYYLLQFLKGTIVTSLIDTIVDAKTDKNADMLELICEHLNVELPTDEETETVVLETTETAEETVETVVLEPTTTAEAA